MKKIMASLLLLFGALVLLFAGCSNSDTFTEKSYSTESEGIEKISVQVEDRELEISASEDDQIRLAYFDSEKEFLEISVSEDNELTIKLVYDKDWTDFIGVKPSAQYRTIEIQVPDDLISSLTASTTNENIEVSPLSFTEAVSLDSNGGNVVCDRVNAGKSVTLKAKNGDISGTIVGGWDDFSISCTIKKGDCNLPLSKEGGEKTFSADCNNGDIDIEFVA